MAKKVEFAALETRAVNFCTMGAELALDSIGTSELWQAHFKAIKTPADRKDMRKGFSEQCIAMRLKDKFGKLLTLEGADKRFERMAAIHCPGTSRKAKANAAKAAAKEAATDAIVGGEKDGKTVMSEKDMAKALIAATMYIADWQGKTQDADTLERLGKLLAIITPKAAKAKAAKA